MTQVEIETTNKLPGLKKWKKRRRRKKRRGKKRRKSRKRRKRKKRRQQKSTQEPIREFCIKLKHFLFKKPSLHN